MKKLFFLAVLFSLFVGCGKQKKYSDYPIAMLDIKKVELTDSFWLPKIKTVQNTTIAFGFDKCVKEGRLENFLIAGKKKKGKVHGKMPFDDTDVYKIIEGASYSLISAPNKTLEDYLDSIIAIISIGQEDDGYITPGFRLILITLQLPGFLKQAKDGADLSAVMNYITVDISFMQPLHIILQPGKEISLISQ